MLQSLAKKSPLWLIYHALDFSFRQQSEGLHYQSLKNYVLLVKHCICSLPFKMILHYAEAAFNRIELRWVTYV